MEFSSSKLANILKWVAHNNKEIINSSANLGQDKPVRIE